MGVHKPPRFTYTMGPATVRRPAWTVPCSKEDVALSSPNDPARPSDLPPDGGESAPDARRPVVKARTIIEDIHRATGFERGQIGLTLTALYNAVAERLKGGEDVVLQDFVSFSVKEYRERDYFVPPTQEYISRGPASRLRVQPATTFKKRV